LNKKTGLAWQVDDEQLAERLSKDENYELVKPEVKKPKEEEPISPIAKAEKPSNKK
jgi:hypothetical protein